MSDTVTSPAPAVTGIHHVSIGVTDVDAATEFFGWLGLSVITTRPQLSVEGVWLQAGEQQVHLIRTDVSAPGIENHFAFRVADLDGCLAMLAEHGVSVRPPIAVPGTGRQSFVRDPSGNVIELNQPNA